MYSLDPSAARQADERNGRITEIGKYIGILTRAEDTTSPKGTRGVDFAFETPEKLSANFTLWTLNKSGESIYGFKQLQALMACLRVRNIAPKTAMVRKWDRTAQGMVDVEGQIFEDLMNKPIGILFETEDYQKFTNGAPDGVGTKVVPAYFFDAKSELTASEILDKKVTPAQLTKLVLTLHHRPLKNAVSASSGAAQGALEPAGGGFIDDDIPF
jgi:hypothetical protein